MPTQSEKFQWLGLSRTLEDVDEDDLPDDTISLSNLNINLSSIPTVINSNLEVTVENNLEQSISEYITVTVDSEVRGGTTVNLSDTQSDSITIMFRFYQTGNKTVTVNAGSETISTDIRVR